MGTYRINPRSEAAWMLDQAGLLRYGVERDRRYGGSGYEQRDLATARGLVRTAARWTALARPLP